MTATIGWAPLVCRALNYTISVFTTILGGESLSPKAKEESDGQPPSFPPKWQLLLFSFFIPASPTWHAPPHTPPSPTYSGLLAAPKPRKQAAGANEKSAETLHTPP